MVHLIKVSGVDCVSALARVDLLLGVDVLGLVEVSMHVLNVVLLANRIAPSIGLHHGGALRWLHHGQNLGETLTILNIDARKTNVTFNNMRFSV